MKRCLFKNNFMKIIISLLLFLFLHTSVSAKRELIISLNMNECVNCYNALSSLKDIDPSLSLTYILPKEYAIDSLELQEYLSLPKEGKWIFSDTLNRKYLINNIFSSITFVEGNEAMTFSVNEELDNDLVMYFNSLLQDEYIYTFDKNIFKTSVKDMSFYKNYVFLSNKLTRDITKANLITGASEVIFKYTDEVIDQAYDLENKNRAFIFGIGNEYEVKNLYTTEKFDVYDDKIYVMTKYLDYEFGRDFKDTFQIYFLSLQVFDFYGELLNTYSVQSVIKDKLSKENKFYTKTTVFKVENDSTFHIGLSSYEMLSDVINEGYFIGEYFLNKKNTKLEFVQSWPFSLGEKYKYINYHYSHGIFSSDGKAVVNVLNDSVYVYDNKNFSSYGLELFENATFLTVEMLYSVEEYNIEAAITDSFIYVSYVIDNDLKYVKKDRFSETKIIKDVFNYYDVPQIEHFTSIDYFNYDYLIIPIDHHKIKRYNFFK